MKYLMWLLKAAIFFTLFAFALNNQQAVAVNFFFGALWNAPLVLVVLAAFACGLALGVLLMMPRWWKKRSTSRAASLHAASVLPLVAGEAAMTQEGSSIPHHGL